MAPQPASRAAAAAACATPASVSDGSPVPEKRFSSDSGVWPCRSSSVVVGAAGASIQPCSRFGAAGSGASEAVGSCSASQASAASAGPLSPPTRQTSPRPAASIASLASRSAWLFSARGIHEKRTRGSRATSAAASRASGFIAGCLTCQRPLICSTTSLESIRTSTSDGSSSSAAVQPGDEAAVLRDVVGGAADPGGALGEHLAADGVADDRAVAGRTRVAARPPVGLDDEPARHQRPDSAVRTMIRPHSSCWSTSSGAAARIADFSLFMRSRRQPPQRPRLISPAPTPPSEARIRS